MVLFFNEDAFKSLGMFELGRDNLYKRINQTWARTLCISVEEATRALFISVMVVSATSLVARKKEVEDLFM